jgi:UDP-glucuronate 4-epimerase
VSILITGSAGFIGFHTASFFLKQGLNVIGVDNFTPYYDPELKRSRNALLLDKDNYSFYQIDLCNFEKLSSVFKRHSVTGIIHLAAQPGVRYSISNPHSYLDGNITGFLNILECARQFNISHLVTASSSSVYGQSDVFPFSEDANTNNPVSLYGATKKANEVMASAYSHLYKIPITCLRFFTVYGPWGRPDQAVALFLNSIKKAEPLKVFNNGDMKRDFTYVDDISKAIFLTFNKPPTFQNHNNLQPLFNIFNIGNGSPVSLMDFIQCIEVATEKKAILDFQELQPGDAISTYADTSALYSWIKFKPSTTVADGIRNCVDWHDLYYGK